jgi:antitoxin component YwqK of YwqJK toxin-antitoxin module
MRYFIFILLLFTFCSVSQAQKGDTLRKYLNESLEYADKNDAAYAAMAIRNGEYWFMMAVYPDTSVLLKAYFKDKKLTLKEGPFTLYFPKGIKAMEGNYTNNILLSEWATERFGDAEE